MPRSAARITRPPQPEPRPYGWRLVYTTRPDGRVIQDEVPLTLEDVLHPQENDIIPENDLQRRDSEYLAPIFRERAERLPGGLALADCLVDWGVPGIRPHAPDLSVFQHVRRPLPQNLGLLRLRDWGGRCV